LSRVAVGDLARGLGDPRTGRPPEGHLPPRGPVRQPAGGDLRHQGTERAGCAPRIRHIAGTRRTSGTGGERGGTGDWSYRRPPRRALGSTDHRLRVLRVLLPPTVGR